MAGPRNRDWFVIVRICAFVMLALLVPCLVGLAIASGGSRTGFIPWVTVILVAMVVARGSERFKKLARIFKV
jgi:hypothetical protein